MKKTVARRRFLQGALILPMGWVMPSAAAESQARRQQVAAAIAEVFGPNRTARAGKVQVKRRRFRRMAILSPSPLKSILR